MPATFMRLLSRTALQATLLLACAAQAQQPTPEGAAAPSAAAPASAAAAASEPVAAPEPSCSALTGRAMAADLRAAQAQGQPLQQQGELLDEAMQAWRAAVARCESRARERAQRHLADDQKQRAAISERQGAGAACESTQRDAASLQELARQAFGERRWPEAAALYRKVETMWDLAAEQCSGAQQASAGRHRDQAAIDAHNAEFCAPPFEQARALTQKFRSQAAGLSAADKQAQSQQAETAWRDAAGQCKGGALELAGNNAQALARERGTPWVASRPAASAPASPAPSSTAPAPVAASVAPVSPLIAPPPTTSPRLASPAVVPSAAVAPVAAAEPTRPLDVRAGDTRYKGMFVREEGQVVSGSGRVEWANGDVYEGALLRSQRHGQGELVWANGQRYKGEWQADKASGRGQMRFANGDRFEGSLVDAVPEGEGEFTYANGDAYHGQVRQGVPHGRGRYQWSNGQSYEGEWVQDKAQGRGLLRFANGNRYEGEVRDGLPQGLGVMQYTDGSEYRGDFQRGISQGKGQQTWPNGDRYSGGWQAGRRHGQGVFTWASGDRWEGVFKDDQQTDEGELIRKP